VVHPSSNQQLFTPLKPAVVHPTQLSSGLLYSNQQWFTPLNSAVVHYTQTSSGSLHSNQQWFTPLNSAVVHSTQTSSGLLHSNQSRQLPPCSPSRLSLGTALVHRSFNTKDTSVCRLICAAVWRPYSTTNEGEVWALKRTRNLQDCVFHSWPYSYIIIIIIINQQLFTPLEPAVVHPTRTSSGSSHSNQQWFTPLKPAVVHPTQTSSGSPHWNQQWFTPLKQAANHQWFTIVVTLASTITSSTARR